MNIQTMKRMAGGIALVSHLLWYLTISLSVLAGLFTLAGAFGMHPDQSVSLDVPLQIVYPTSGDSPISSATPAIRLVGAPQTTVEIPIRDIHTPERLFFFGALLCNTLTMYMLVAFLRDVRAGKPFQPANARRIRWVGLSLIFAGICGDASGYLLAQRLIASPAISDAHATIAFDLDGGFLVIGMLILLFAEIFRLGAYLQHEQDLTV